MFTQFFWEPHASLTQILSFPASNSPCQAHFLKLNNAWQCIQANNYPHKFSASKCKTTATEERKFGLIIKMCQVRVQQLFLFNKPCYLILWLAFLGHGLSLTQDLIKCTAFVTKWRTISLSLTLPLLWSLLTDEGWIIHHFETSLQCRHSYHCVKEDQIQLSRTFCVFPKTAANRLKKLNLDLQLLRLFCILLLEMFLHVPFSPGLTTSPSSWPLQSTWLTFSYSSIPGILIMT